MPDEIAETLRTVFDQLSMAVLIITPEGQIVFANHPAEAMLEKGWPIRKSDGSLQGKDRASSEHLRRAIEAISGKSEGVPPVKQDYELCLAQSAEGQKGAIAHLRPLARASGAASLIALFIAEMGQASQYGIDALAEAYGLSKAETRILKKLVEAQTPAEVAKHLNLSVSTVKSHIRKIFHKTNTSRQADLLRLVECSRTPLRKMGDSGDIS